MHEGTTGPGAGAVLLDGVLQLPERRLPARGGRRAAADPDEDAITLAAAAVLALLARRPGVRPAALLFATVSPPYAAGGNVQPLAELTGLQGDVVALELTATVRDGAAALRLAAALARERGPVLVAAAHRASEGGEEGDGAAAVLIGAGAGAAAVVPGAARAEEARERWRLEAEPGVREGDPTVTTAHLEQRVRAVLEAGAPPPAVVSLAGVRATDRTERALGGSGDPVAPRAGLLGAAHPLARLLVGLDAPQVLVATANGLTEAVATAPLAGAGEVAARARAALEAGVEADAPLPAGGDPEGFSPYQSLPRAWRERGAELRLEAASCAGCGRIVYPPPAGACPSCGRPGPHRPALLGREGSVLTHTRDHAYPGAAGTGMAVVELDGGGRFYGQVVPSGEVRVGERVRLVPRVLHRGGGVVQYFWKVEPCR